MNLSLIALSFLSSTVGYKLTHSSYAIGAEAYENAAKQISSLILKLNIMNDDRNFSMFAGRNNVLGESSVLRVRISKSEIAPESLEAFCREFKELTGLQHHSVHDNLIFFDTPTIAKFNSGETIAMNAKFAEINPQAPAIAEAVVKKVTENKSKIEELFDKHKKPAVEPSPAEITLTAEDIAGLTAMLDEHRKQHGVAVTPRAAGPREH